MPEPPGPVSIRVVVADDHPLFRKSVVDILQKSGGIQVVGEAANGQEAVDLTCGLEPDVLVLDLAMPVMDGTEATARIRLAGVATHILILTATEDVQSLFEVFRNGAQSCLIKTVHPDELVSAIRTAASGGTVIPSHLVSAIWSEMSQSSPPKAPETRPLTVREIEVLRQIRTGASNRDIAENLNISENAIRNCTHAIFSKLRVANRAQAIAYAVREGLFEKSGGDA